MSTIVAAHFEQPEQLDRAVQELKAQGFSEQEYAVYYLNPPGQHGLTPIGGDVHSDEGAEEAGKGAVTGATLGGAVGLAVGGAVGMAAGGIALPVGLLAGAGVGAYTGSLVGALGKTHEPNPEEASREHPIEPPAGPMLAVCVDRAATETLAIMILNQAGAREIERSEGRWVDGEWLDFDPRRPAETIKADTRR